MVSVGQEDRSESQVVAARPLSSGAEMKALRKTLQDNADTIARLEGELASLLTQIAWTVRTRDTLGAQLRSLFLSPIWRFTKPLRAMARMLGKQTVTIDQLVPMTPMQRGEGGSWVGTGPAQFLIPIQPLQGWVRVRAKVSTLVSSTACFFFDTGAAFHEGERFDLSPVGGEMTIDRFVPLRKTTFMIRFDAMQHHGTFTVHSFTLEPISRAAANLMAMTENVRRMIVGSESHHRPSILLGLKLLFGGNWRQFHRQLLHNAGGDIASSYHEEWSQLWEGLHKLTEPMRQSMRTTMTAWQNPPLISVIVPVYNVDEVYLRKCINSVIVQVYPHWELCIADDASPKSHVKTVLQEYAAKDPRIKVAYRTKNENISAASNTALEMATGSYIALLDHDDELSEHALFRMAEAIIADPALDMIYSDEDKLAPDGTHTDPFFKPDWSPEYFLSCMYTCHLGVYRADLVKLVGGFRSDFDSAQDYDLVLRIVGKKPKIQHIPDVLYHWRKIETSSAAERVIKPEAHERARQAIQQYLISQGKEAVVEDGPAPGCHAVRYEVKGNPKISIIIPSACQRLEIDGQPAWMVLRLVQSVRQISTYDNIEIIVVDRSNMPAELENELRKLDVRRVVYNFDFNWSKVNNHGAAAATGEILLFLNDDMQPITPDWLQWMIGYAQQPDIGAVGAKLVYPDGSLQHTGVVLPGGNPTHAFYRYPGTHPGHFYSAMVHRNWSAVTGACLMTRAELFHSIGEFDGRFPLNYNDVEYGLRLQDRGLRVVYTPEAKLYHFESKTRSPEVRAEEMTAIHGIWRKRFRWDPYYNPNLATDSNDFRTAPVHAQPLNLLARITNGEAPGAPPKNAPINRDKWLATRQKFSRDYLIGDGLEIGALHQPLWTTSAARVRYVDRFDVPGLREHYPELKDFKLVDVDILDDGEKLATVPDDSQDFIIGNHMLEHCENPIGTIRSHLKKVRPGGILYYAVPDKRRTFDIERDLTPFEHTVEDDRLGPERSRRQHFLEWSQWVNHKSGTQIEAEADRLMIQNYSIHYHVWDDDAFRQFVESTRTYLGDPFNIEQLVENEFETIAVLRKRGNHAGD